MKKIISLAVFICTCMSTRYVAAGGEEQVPATLSNSIKPLVETCVPGKKNRDLVQQQLLRRLLGPDYKSVTLETLLLKPYLTLNELAALVIMSRPESKL